MELKVAAGYVNTAKSMTHTFECMMFTWKRGSNPRRAENTPIDASWKDDHDRSLKKKTWIIRGSEEKARDWGVVNMVGCSQNSTHTDTTKPSKSLIFLETKQIEFFIRHFKKVSPMYDTSGNFSGCNTEIDGRPVYTDKFDEDESECTCQFPPIYSCNPIRTIRNISGKVFPCKTDPGRPGTEIPKADVYEEYIWLPVIFICLLVLLNVTGLLVYFYRRRQIIQASSNRSVTAREDDLESDDLPDLPPPVSFHSCDKFFTNGTHTASEAVKVDRISASPIQNISILNDPDLQSSTLTD